MANITLGKASAYPDRYDPSMLQAILRADARSYLAQSNFLGQDLWTAYELSWLNPKGVPRVALAEIAIDAQSARTVESKSFKYYLNSFNQTKFASEKAVSEAIQRDLSALCGAQVTVDICDLNSEHNITTALSGKCVDDIDSEADAYQPDASLLLSESGTEDDDVLFSHLLKSNCPVTDQPDWASVWVKYKGEKIRPESFLKYIVAFRQYQGFHESCVEKIFVDIQKASKATSLCVYARYTRRGGLDINPVRYTADFIDKPLPFKRLIRQ